ncbi:SecD/SecF fusion protein [Faunimonas pinastri]|uniref:Protein translocase subunit SecD n=1 Tax=Faunimonas pinastri TaxID=1855383 RepID=A0A1H9CRA8_9HYPH|nr:protein translocase subunit SecD [Faunimonas pinastri]SEQ03752.1 SecD/SecF fusion protein [Faunimonas pinastri]
MLYFARWKITLIVLVILAGIVVLIPSAFTREQVANWPSFLPKKQMVLGLDLRGGAHLLLQVQRSSLIRDRLQTLTDDVRQKLRDEHIGYQNLSSRGQAVQFTLRDPADAEKVMTALKPLAAPIQSGMLSGGTLSEVSLSQNNGQISANLTDDGIDHRVRSAVDQSLGVLGRRINALGTVEPSIQREGSDRIMIEVPGLQDTARLKEVLGQTAKMTFHLECADGSLQQALQSRPPAGCEIAQPAEANEQPVLINSHVELSGDDLVDAQPTFDSQSNQPIVSFRFNSRGASIFGRLTQENVGKRFAVILDNKVITAPVIRGAIVGGSGQIEGNFTVESAQNLAVLLRAGALPANFDVVEERTVGPSLGQDSIRAGQIAGIIGLVAVAIFMVALYGILGVFADIALLVNVILIMGILVLLQATLTLPGIAGIVLTMGMAVDANVLIYERMREEQKLGRSAISAIEAGFSRAFATIIDAHITALIAAFALFALGSGPIRGFAVTLAVGIFTTLFTAILVTRLIVSIWVRSRRPKVVPI